MGSLENNEEDNRTSRKNTLIEDFCNDATQKIDSQFSQGDEDDDFLGGTNGIPSHDPFLVQDAFETQLVNVYEETQVMDYDDETQVLDDLDCLRSWPADCNPEAVASESEGTSTTEVLCDTQVVSEHDTTNSCDQRQVANVSGISSDTYKNEEHHSGSVCEGPAFLRTEAFRAVGLAARAGGTNRDLCSSMSDKSLQDQGKSVQADFPDQNVSDKNLARNVCTEGVENQRNVNPIRASTAVRKLFMEDEVAKVVRSEANMNLTDDCNNPEFLSSESCLAGLSYANSEPPGELSQAMALEVVDKFLEQNIMEYDKSIETRIHTAEKAKLDSGAKGSRDLASFKLRHLVGVSGVYDWDDNREDEGGGDFFLKKKEAFYNNGDTKKGSLTEPRKRKRSDLKNINSAGDHGDKQQQTCNETNVGDLVCSDPGLMLHKRRAKSQSVHCGEKVIHKNLAKDLDEQINLASENRLADIEGRKDIPVVENIGPDTQMAAEAMENLCFEVHLADENNTMPEKGVGSTTRRTTKKHQSSNKDSSGEPKLAKKRQRATSGGVITRRTKHATSGTIGATNKFSPISAEKSTRATNEHGRELGGREQRRMAVSNSEEKLCSSTQPTNKRRSGLRSSVHDVDPQHGTELTGQRSGMEKKSLLQDQLGFSVPVAHRTRKRTDPKQFKVSGTSLDATNVLDLRCNRRAAKDKNIKMITIEELKRLKSTRSKLSNLKDGGASSASYLDDLKHIKGKSTHLENLEGQKDGRHVNPSLRRLRTNASSTSLDAGRNLADHASKSNASGLSSVDKKAKFQNDLENQRSGNDLVHHDVNYLKTKTILEDASEASATKQVGKKTNAKTLRSSECTEKNCSLEASPRERAGTTSTCTTPASCATPANRPSPVCMGDEYNKQSKVRLSLVREMNNLVSGSPGSPGEMKESRKRREITGIRVLFSQHLDVDVVKQQKKILGRLGATIASSMLDATHFVADEFVRTRNMLEAIALGKPVVTHLWLESCGQASCAIDEKSYILRDVRKEKEIGFSMPISLSRACQHPLLQEQKVLVTPNTKPGKDILASLVTAVHGVAVERLGRSVLKSEKLPDDILILSCEEDYDICVPFLEKGGAIYSSELLLNGIVKQKLEYERHRLFEDHVKRTRSTIRVKKNGYLPMSKCKL